MYGGAINRLISVVIKLYWVSEPRLAALAAIPFPPHFITGF